MPTLWDCYGFQSHIPTTIRPTIAKKAKNILEFFQRRASRIKSTTSSKINPSISSND